MLACGPREPAQRRPLVARDAVAVEQQLAIGRLRVGMAGRRRRPQERRAIVGRTREARGDLVRRQVGERQKPTFTVPNTVRPAAIVA